MGGFLFSKRIQKLMQLCQKGSSASLFGLLAPLMGAGVVSTLPKEEPECLECRFEKRQLQRELAEIDYALKQLNDLRLLYRARALWNLDLATRLQFKKERTLETRKAFAEADYEWKQVDLIEKKIRFLENRREDLLKNG